MFANRSEYLDELIKKTFDDFLLKKRHIVCNEHHTYLQLDRGSMNPYLVIFDKKRFEHFSLVLDIQKKHLQEAKKRYDKLSYIPPFLEKTKNGDESEPNVKLRKTHPQLYKEQVIDGRLCLIIHDSPKISVDYMKMPGNALDTNLWIYPSNNECFRSVLDLKKEHLDMLKRMKQFGDSHVESLGYDSKKVKWFLHFPMNEEESIMHFHHSLGIDDDPLEEQERFYLDDIVDGFERGLDIYQIMINLINGQKNGIMIINKPGIKRFLEDTGCTIELYKIERFCKKYKEQIFNHVVCEQSNLSPSSVLKLSYLSQLAPLIKSCSCG